MITHHASNDVSRFTSPEIASPEIASQALAQQVGPSAEPVGESSQSVAPPLMPSLEAPAASSAAPAATSREAVAKLSDTDLLVQLTALVRQEHDLTVAVLVHLAEVERRGLHLANGCSSLFAYCAQRLGFDDGVAYKRVGAARYARRFPLVLDLVAEGRLHLSALMLIGPHLTDVNHRDWLMSAAGKSKREVEKMVASRWPKPDVPTSVRKVPEREARPDAGPAAVPSEKQTNVANATQPAAIGDEQPSATGSGQSSATGSGQSSATGSGQSSATGSEQPAATGSEQPAATGSEQPAAAGTTRPASVSELLPSAARARVEDRPRVQPLSASTYRVVFTASESLKQKLDRARELCSHSVAPGDLPALVERAFELLIEHEQKRRCAVRTPRTRSTKDPGTVRTRPLPTPLLEPAPDCDEPAAPGDRPPDPLLSVEEQRSPHRVACRREPDPAASVETQKTTHRAAAQQEPDPATSVENQTPRHSAACQQEPDPVTLVETQNSLRTEAHQRKPNSNQAVSLSEFSRHVPASVRRAVWERDGGQCAFVDAHGNRCTERLFLEIDHIDAHARGGATAVGNCRLMCRAHNMHHARVTFGTQFVDRAQARSRTRAQR